MQTDNLGYCCCSLSRLGVVATTATTIVRPSRTTSITILANNLVPIWLLTTLLHLLTMPLVVQCAAIFNFDNYQQSATSSSSARYVQYRVENSSTLDDLAKKAFMSLQSEAVIEQPLLTPEQKRMHWLQKYMRKQMRFEKKGKKIFASPKEALEQVNHEITIGRFDEYRKMAQCEGQIFKQRIQMDGCLPKFVHNRFCHGTCTSYFIPRLRPRKLKLKPLFRSCSACQPSKWDTVEVKLDCPMKMPKELIRKVIKVKKCSCIALGVDSLDGID